MVSPSIRVTNAGDKPLSVLSELIQKRRSILGESAKDAVVATAIDALVSIRAATRTAAGKKKTKPTVQDTGWYGSFSASDRRPCFRSGVGRYAPRIDPGKAHVRWLTKGVPHMQQHVYLVTPEHKEVAPYYVVCSTPAVAEAFEQRAAMHRIDRFGDLAKHALGVGMAKISTRNVSSKAGPKARATATKLAFAQSGDIGERGYFVEVTDGLDYGMDALKGGKGTVDLAIKKAANKIAGRLAKEVAGRPFAEKVETPFPEVRRRK